MLLYVTGFPGGSVGKNLLAHAGDSGSIAGLGRSPWEGNGNPLQYSCLESPMDRRAWQATVHGIAELDMTVHMLHCILFIQSSGSGYLGCFHLLVLANNTLWTRVYKQLFELPLSILLGIYPEVKLLGSYGNSVWFFWGTNILFSIAVVLLSSPQQHRKFPISPHLCQHLLFCIFNKNHINRYKVVGWFFK